MRGGNHFHRKAKPALSPTPPTPQPKTPPPVFPEEDYAPSAVAEPPYQTYTGVPNKTEAAYNRDVLHGKGRFEAITLRLPGGNYTPDWMTLDDGCLTLHEVKGSYRFGSESRAILAFRSAAAAFPFFRFVWAMKAKGGKWIVKHVLNDRAPLPAAATSQSPASLSQNSLFVLPTATPTTAATARTTDAAPQETDRAM